MNKISFSNLNIKKKKMLAVFALLVPNPLLKTGTIPNMLALFRI